MMVRHLLTITIVSALFYAGCSSPSSNQNASTAGGANANNARAAAGNSNSSKPAAANNNTANANAGAPAAAPAKSNSGAMEVTSTPPGAGVTLVPTAEDSAGMPQAYGATPAMITGLAPGTYTVNVSKPGYKNFQKEVKLKAGETLKINAALRK